MGYDDKTYVYDEEKLKEVPVGYNIKMKKGMPTWIKVIIIILLIAVISMGVSYMLGYSLEGIFSKVTRYLGIAKNDNEIILNYNYDYIATVYVRDELDEESTGAYNHAYLLELIDKLKNDEHNKGIILWINTPGGSVFASDELYLKLKEYKEESGKPIYSSYQSQATSGGYYISCLSDEIYANRNCWTGSIGVTMGTILDVSGFLDKLGVRTNTITSGRNKAMGSSYEEMTSEQRAIMQSLVDDAYEQFVGIVADGRGMSIDQVKALADGRIYTANQALQNGLIDGIATYEETIVLLKEALGDNSIKVVEFKTESSKSPLSFLESDLNQLSSSELEKLIDMNGKIEFSYICDLKK